MVFLSNDSDNHWITETGGSSSASSLFRPDDGAGFSNFDEGNLQVWHKDEASPEGDEGIMGENGVESFPNDDAAPPVPQPDFSGNEMPENQSFWKSQGVKNFQNEENMEPAVNGTEEKSNIEKAGFWEPTEAKAVRGDGGSDDDALAPDKDDSGQEHDAEKFSFWETSEAKALQEDDESKDKVVKLWMGGQTRQKAQQHLEKIVEESKNGLEAILREQIFEALVSPFHQEWTGIFDKLESDIVGAFRSNTKRRSNLQRHLRAYDEKWNKTYHRLTARIQDIASEEEEGSVEASAETTGKGHTRADNTYATPNSSEKEEEEADDEKDLYALLNQDHAPTVERVERFLQSRERLQAAEEKFQMALDEVHSKIQATTDSLLQVAVDVYGPLDDSLGDMESELQFYLVQNFQRRKAMAEAVEEKAKAAQSVFQRLMARVKTLGGKRKRTPTEA